MGHRLKECINAAVATCSHVECGSSYALYHPQVMLLGGAQQDTRVSEKVGQAVVAFTDLGRKKCPKSLSPTQKKTILAECQEKL